MVDLVKYGALAGEAVVEVDANGLVRPMVNRVLNGLIYDDYESGNTVQPYDGAGDPVTVMTDAAGGISTITPDTPEAPGFFVDNDLVDGQVWIDRGQDPAGNPLPRLRLHPQFVGGAVPLATETSQGIAEIATTDEVTAGTDDARIVTPLKLADRLATVDGTAAVGDHEGAASPHPQYLLQQNADDLYVALDSVGQPEGVAALDASGKVPTAAVPTIATPQAGQIPRYNGDGNLPTNDPVADRDAANRRWTLEQVDALAGIAPPAVLGANFTPVATPGLPTETIPGFSVAVQAGESYMIAGLIHYEAGAGEDIQIQIDAPTTGLTLRGYSHGYDTTATAGVETWTKKLLCYPTPNRRTAVHGGIGLGAVHAPINFEAFVQLGANGTLQIDVARNLEDTGEALTVLAGSYVLFAKVSAA